MCFYQCLLPNTKCTQTFCSRLVFRALQGILFLHIILSWCKVSCILSRKLYLLWSRFILSSITLLFYTWCYGCNSFFNMNDRRKSQICGGCEVRTWPLSAYHSLEHGLPSTLTPVRKLYLSRALSCCSVAHSILILCSYLCVGVNILLCILM